MVPVGEGSQSELRLEGQVVFAPSSSFTTSSSQCSYLATGPEFTAGPSPTDFSVKTKAKSQSELRPGTLEADRGQIPALLLCDSEQVTDPLWASVGLALSLHLSPSLFQTLHFRLSIRNSVFLSPVDLTSASLHHGPPPHPNPLKSH